MAVGVGEVGRGGRSIGVGWWSAVGVGGAGGDGVGVAGAVGGVVGEGGEA